MRSDSPSTRARLIRRPGFTRVATLHGIVACLLLGAVELRTADASLLFVDQTATGTDDGSSWTNAFVDLQDALAAASPGDEVWVAAGFYTPSAGDAAASFHLESGVALYGGFAGTETVRHGRNWDVHVTTLSGDIGHDDIVGSGVGWYLGWNRNSANSGHVVVASGTDASAVIDGFRIADGATGPVGTPAGDPLTVGSGIYIVDGSPTIRNCTFEHNLAAFGSGACILNVDASPTILDCRFLENYVHLGSGAGIYNHGTSLPTIRDCEFARNHCVAASGDALGGGIAHRASTPILIERCRFEGNQCRPFYSVGNYIGYGGGIGTLSVADITVRDCVFVSNEAQLGAGVMMFGSGSIVNCLFMGNEAIPQPRDPYPEIGGSGAGAYATDALDVVNCTFAFNWGKKHVALEVPGTGANILNTIIWGNTGTSPEVVGYWREQLGGSFDASYSCIEQIFDEPEAGEDPIEPENLPGCIDLDPIFVEPSSRGDLHLAAGSPCIDAGSNGAVPAAVVTDLDGGLRFYDDPAVSDTGEGEAPVVDMGALEAQLDCGGIDGANVLLVNGDSGTGSSRIVFVNAGGPITFRIDRPEAGGNGKFLVHMNAGEPDAFTITSLPASLGKACFPMLIPPFGDATPVAVWNKIGKASRVGSSSFFGLAIQDPQERAPTDFFTAPAGDPELPVGSRFTLQGVVSNPDGTSPKRVSLTNPVILIVN